MRRLPFWLHQVLEYVLGIGLIFQATQGGSMVPVVVVGAVLLVVAATVDGPLGAWDAMSRPQHRVVDIAVVFVAAALAVVPGTGIDALARSVLGLGAVLLGLLVVLSDYSPKRPRRPMPDSEELGRAAGRFVGRTVQSYRRKAGRQ